MLRKVITISALVLIATATALAGFTYRGRIRAVFAKTSTSTDAGGRKVLYWYAPMNPNYHSDHPGKSPMGMDLLPKYADEDASASGTQAAPARKILYWYAPMNPNYHSDHPGKSPMGMDLLPKYADDAGVGMAPGTVKISPQTQQMIGVRTATVERSSLTRTIRTTGHLVPDETKLAHVHVKVKGWIDKVYVDFVGQLVKKGQPLFTVYSPDLVATEQEYLIARKGEDYLASAPYRQISEGASSLLDATRDRLKLWDISDDQIARLEKTGKIERTMTFYSPVSGFVLDRQAYPQTAVGPDKELYLVADLSDIWVNADVYEYEIPYVHLGQKAAMQLSYYPGKTYAGKVTYIYPTVDPQTRTVKVRLEFPNPNFDLKPQMFADVELNVDYGTNVLVPAEAVLDSGSRQTVFLATGNGYFEPRDIKVGPRVDDKVVVLSGLQPGETIVTSGNFLIDSESRLSAATGDMSSQKN
jgi:Cu(I)/Ag(I) efflux system membrane fusion protein/cobalt-zinc-cadmium efflux system membrane fusion protein